MKRTIPLLLIAVTLPSAGFMIVDRSPAERAAAPGVADPLRAEAEHVEIDRARPVVRVAPAAAGLSGALRVLYAMPGQKVHVPLEGESDRVRDAWYRWTPQSARVKASGTTQPLPANGRLVAPASPGVYHLEVGWRGGADASVATLIVKTPYDSRRRTTLNGYRIGRYPDGSGRYAPPTGLVEVTPENQNLRISEHFRLREFLTKDQTSKWPKYVIIDLRLIDKLELVMAELQRRGIRADRMAVMSGYRTPQYNGQGVGAGGRASLSRHQYGDAADVWVDNDGDWYMDDLNGDGRRDTGDVRVMLSAVEAVERRYPELVGGAGVYRATSAHGPFIHIDTRGRRARW